MKRLNLLVTFILFLTFLQCNNTKQSNEITAFTKDEIKRIVTLCKVWGGLKYFSVNTNIYKINWDQLLMDKLASHPDYYTSDTKLNDVIKSMYDALDPKNIPETSDSIQGNDSLLYWFKNNTIIDKELKANLSKVINYKHWVVNNCDIKLKTDILIPIYETIIKNKTTELPDIETRTFGLFSYWNFINYFCPNRSLTNGNWEDILEQVIPNIICSNSEKSYQTNYLKLFAKLNDGHAFAHCRLMENIYTKYNHNKIVIDNSVITKINEPVEQLKIGDSLISINGNKMDSLIEVIKEIIPASNPSFMNRQVKENFFAFVSDSIVNIELVREKKNLHLTIEKSQLFSSKSTSEKDTIKWKKLNNDIVYINCGNIKTTEIKGALSSLNKKKIKLILDLRKYPSDFLFDSIHYYLKHPIKQYVTFTGINPKHPGSFINVGSYSTIPNGTNAFEIKKCIIIVDNGTMSHGEFSAMAYSVFPNTLVMGKQTAGADGDINEISLPGNIQTWYSSLGVYYPNGINTQGVGVKIDIPISISNKKDLLELAIENLNKN